MSDYYRSKLKFDEYGTRRILSDQNVYCQQIVDVYKTVEIFKNQPI